jgi:hypothetical protein
MAGWINTSKSGQKRAKSVFSLQYLGFLKEEIQKKMERFI